MNNILSRMFGPRIGALLLAIVTLTASSTSSAAVYLSVAIAPPPLPVYEQPPIPGPGYMWTPGYWAWGPDGYYWVPGTWVLVPFVGALWTPGYWGWGGGAYFWHAGYWGPHVGFYGGINYGFGYAGVGYQGGYWDHDAFRYNRAVNNVSVTNITNTYNTTVVHNGPPMRVSYNGGSGGVSAQPTPQERIAERERHTPLLPVQAHHELAASTNRALLASMNHGQPAVAATRQPERFSGGAAPARSFSQQAAVRPGAVPPRSGTPAPRARNEQRPERGNVAANPGSPQFQAAPRTQGPGRAPAPQQGRPPGDARAPHGAPQDHQGERQHG